jgi:hypothetical protein
MGMGGEGIVELNRSVFEVLDGGIGGKDGPMAVFSIATHPIATVDR